MLRLLTVSNKMVSYEYFMDEMQEYEVDIMVQNLPYCDQSDWLMTRYIVWSNLKPYLKKKSMTPMELFPLPFDKDNNPGYSEIKVTDKDITQLKELFKKQNKNEEQ